MKAFIYPFSVLSYLSEQLKAIYLFMCCFSQHMFGKSHMQNSFITKYNSQDK